MIQPTPGIIVTAKVSWTDSPRPVGTQLLFFSPTLAAHHVPCVFEGVVQEASDHQIVKLRLLAPVAKVPTGVEFKLQTNALHEAGEGITQEDA